MNDNDIKKVFENMTAGTDSARVVYGVQSSIGGKNTSKIHMRFPRAVLTAACVMLALTVSVGAYAVYKQLNIDFPDDGPFDYIVNVGENEAEMISLSDEVIAKLAEYEIVEENISGLKTGRRFSIISFKTWHEAANWLGFDILTSELFGETPDHWNYIYGRDVVLHAYYSADDELTHLELIGSDMIIGEDSSCITTITIPLSGDWERYSGAVMIAGYTENDNRIYENEDGRLMIDSSKPSPNSTEVITYESPNGLQAEITVTELDDDYSMSGYVFHNSIIYDFKISGAFDRDIELETLKTVIDSLE